jgi:hypothetical protein
MPGHRPKSRERRTAITDNSDKGSIGSWIQQAGEHPVYEINIGRAHAKHCATGATCAGDSQRRRLCVPGRQRRTTTPARWTTTPNDNPRTLDDNARRRPPHAGRQRQAAAPARWTTTPGGGPACGDDSPRRRPCTGERQRETTTPHAPTTSPGPHSRTTTSGDDPARRDDNVRRRPRTRGHRRKEAAPHARLAT